MQEFIHLNVHSHYSISESLITIPTAVDKAIADGMKGMALTDNGVMYGIKEFWDYCKTVNRARQHEGLEPFKPILGCEMYVARRGDKSLKDSIEDKGGWRLTVLAKNVVGYRNLMKLVCRSWVDGLNEYPRTDYKDLAELREGLIITTAGISGEVSTKILRGNLAGAEERVKWFRDIWGDDFYIELRRHIVSNPAQKANRNIAEWEKRCEPTLISLARKYGVKIIGSNNCHFLNEEDAEAHDHLYCLKEEKELDDPTRIIFSKQEWLKTQEEMNRVFYDLPEALSNTIEILDKVELYDIESSPLLPEFHIPESFGTVEEWRNRFSIKDLINEFGYDALGKNATDEKYALRIITSKFGAVENLYRIKLEADYLAELAYKGAERLYGTLTPQIEERLRFELHQIKNYAFSNYFLIVQDIVNAAQKELNVWVGPGRGSAVGCLVNYCLGITKVDPLKFGLLFERFFRLNHVSLPDIDIDFDVEGREKVLKWVKDKYGPENCAHIATFSKFSTKSAIKEIARLENLPMEQAHALCRAIPDGWSSQVTLKQLIDVKNDNGNPEYPVLVDAYNSNDTRESNTIKYACQIEGLTAGVGTHPCGFVISPKAITNYVPLMAQGSIDCYGEMADVIQYDRRAIESTGLVVFDFLGLYSLDTMKECVRLIKQNHGIELDLYNIPLDDELTLKLFQKGRTVGVFQFDYEGMREYLKKLKPTTFSDLVALISMYHPGAADYIPYLIARKNGQEPVTYDLPIMEKYLKETYGITVYQEQVMHLAREIGGLSRYQSDVVRKAMGLRKYDIVNAFKPWFIEGGVKNGYDAKILKKIWSDWEEIASYAFNKSHAVAYTQLAYQTAYLKAHYPAEYMSSMLSSGRLSQRQRNEYLDECKSIGIQLLPPDVNKSVLEFAPENDNTIRFGFIGITEIFDDVTDEIIRCRNNGGAFKTIFDFAQRVNREICDKSIFETLAKSGAFDCFGLPREQYLGKTDKGATSIDLIFAYADDSKSPSLFDIDPPILPAVEDNGYNDLLF